MKITRSQLRRIIREEARRLNEQESSSLPTKDELRAFADDMRKQIDDMFFRVHSDEETTSGTHYSDDQFDRDRPATVKLYMDKLASDRDKRLSMLSFIADSLK